jgi:hypothetical protein
MPIAFHQIFLERNHRMIGLPFTRIQRPIAMDPPVPPPDKRASYPSAAMLFIIVGIIVAAFLMFLVFRPH